VPEHDDEDGYRGPARHAARDDLIDVEVVLGGPQEPLDGRYHWYGRVVRHAAVDAAKSAGVTGVGLSIGGCEPVVGRLAEHDAWGNMRITGTGRPPFERRPVEVDLFGR
jgi:hypothetical protein